jgi:Domain of unknown function (DUF4149)
VRATWRFLQTLALGAWLGAILYFAAVVARDAFAVLPNRDDAGAFVGSTLGGLHGMGIIAAAIYFGASLGLGRSLRVLVRPAALCVMLMLLLTIASQKLVMPKMAMLRAEMVSVEATPSADARRVEFDRLHSISVNVEASVVLVGLLALFLTVRRVPD